MGKFKDGMAGIGNKLKSLPKGKQGKAFVRILQFFALMIVLTLFARGAAAVTMPQVEVAGLTQESIRREDKYTGVVTATNKVDVKMPVGLTVAKVNVSGGDTVQQGDELVTFDTGTIEDNLLTQRIALQDLQMQLMELQKPYKQDSGTLDAAKEALANAQENYNDTAVLGSEAVAAAQRLYDDADKEVKRLEKIIKNYDPGTATQEQTDAYNAAVADLPQAKTSRTAAANGIETAKTQAAKDLASAQKTVDAANTALADAQKDYNEATPGFNLESQKRQLEIAQKQNAIKLQQEEVDKLTELAAIGGVVRATTDGTVTQVTPAVGAETTAADYVRISTGDQGYLVEFTVSQDKAREIKPGTLVTVTLGQYYWSSDARVVGRSMPDEGGFITVRAQLSTPDWTDGDSVSVAVVLSDSYYWSCVPTAAVRPESGGYYVLVLAEESTVMGTQLVARKVEVTVQDQDANYAAIDGLYEYDAKVIVSSSKPVKDGDMVRLDEASTK